MQSRTDVPRLRPDLKFVAAVALRFDTPQAIGETPDGVRFDFPVHGTAEGPDLNGRFPPCVAYLLIDPDGIGTINVRAPLLLNDGAVAELEATGRYDFGKDGYQRAIAKDLPNSALGWCPRLLTGHPQYMWLNRVLFLGLGELRPRETRVDYDLFLVSTSGAAVACGNATASPVSGGKSLYERLGGREQIARIMGAFIDALHENVTLNLQNPRIAAAQTRVNPTLLKQKVTDFVCMLVGGPCEYKGRPMRATHAPLGLSEGDWAIGVSELRRILSEFKVQQQEQGELLNVIATTKRDIVTGA